MKKLMFGLACAASVCVLADNHNGFEGYRAGDTNLAWLNDYGLGSDPMYFAYESASGSTDGSTVKTYGVGENLPAFDYAKKLPNNFVSDAANTQYLELSTEGGTLWRGWSVTSDPEGESADRKLSAGADLLFDLDEGQNIYVDTLVQFTPTEDGTAPAVAGADQMAIWLNVDSTNPDAPVTNLCVLAALVDYGTGEASTFTVPNKANGGIDINPGQWYRLTVKTYADLTAGESIPGFAVYIDGKIITTDKPTFSEAYLADLKDGEALTVPTEEVENGSVFASLWTRPDSGMDKTAPTFQGVGFKGSGAIDDLSLTTEVPNFFEAAGAIDFTLTWDANVSAVSYTIAGETKGVADLSTGSTKIEVEAGTVVSIAATAKDWFKVAEGTGDVTVDEEKTVAVKTALVETPAEAGATGLDGVAVADAKEWADAKEITPAQIAACDFALDAYLMNSDLTAKPELVIADIAEVEGGWAITIKAAAGEADIDLGNINGVLKVKSAATLDGLAEAEGVAYDIDVREAGAVIKVAGDNKNFMKAMVTK